MAVERGNMVLIVLALQAGKTKDARLRKSWETANARQCGVCMGGPETSAVKGKH